MAKFYFCQHIMSPPLIRPVLKCGKPTKDGKKECPEHDLSGPVPQWPCEIPWP